MERGRRYRIVLYLSISIALPTCGMNFSEALPTTTIDKQLTQCRSLHAEALQATVSEGFA